MTMKSAASARETSDCSELFDFEKEEAVQESVSDLPDHTNMVLDRKGTYCWVNERPMMKSFFLLFEVWRVLGISALIVLVFLLLIELFQGEGLLELVKSAGVMCLVFGFILLLSLPAYWIVTKANNGKYTVLFEMDDEGICHTQIKTDMARALELLTVYAGRRTGTHAATAAGMLSATGGSLYSRFTGVRKISADPRKNLIRLNGRFVRNQVYTDPEDFDFVYEYILDHCPDAKITHGII